MTCQHCCGAESIFDKKSAKRDLDKYRSKGPNKTTRSLLKALYEYPIEKMTLLDIGGGVGVIQHELLKHGVSSTTDVDASPSYIAKAREEMKENGQEQHMKFIHADFVDVAPSIGQYDIVTLERVVCCYPDVKALLENSSSKAENYFGFIYPRDNWFSRVVIKLMDFYLWLKKNPFRTFVHSEKMMFDILKEQGFEPVYQDNVSYWKVALFKRVNK